MSRGAWRSAKSETTASGASETRRGATGDAVTTPCVEVCRMNPRTGLCEGCARTLDEIARWSSLGDEARRAILARLPERKTPR